MYQTTKLNYCKPDDPIVEMAYPMCYISITVISSEERRDELPPLLSYRHFLCCMWPLFRIIVKLVRNCHLHLLLYVTSMTKNGIIPDITNMDFYEIYFNYYLHVHIIYKTEGAIILFEKLFIVSIIHLSWVSYPKIYGANCVLLF